MGVNSGAGEKYYFYPRHPPRKISLCFKDPFVTRDRIKGLKLWHSPFLPWLGAVKKRQDRKAGLEKEFEGFLYPGGFLLRRRGQKGPFLLWCQVKKDLFYCGAATCWSSCRSSQN